MDGIYCCPFRKIQISYLIYLFMNPAASSLSRLFKLALVFLGLSLFISCSKKNTETTPAPVNPPVVPAEYVPKPVPVGTDGYRIGAFMCPLWTYEKTPSHWNNMFSFKERQPVLGWYEEANPEVIDWEIKYALEHGISFFNVCWYRAKSNEGRAPIVEEYGHWTRGLKKTRYADMFNYCLLFVDQDQMGGVASWADWKDNLVPYWINEHFKRSYYLKIGNKPVFTIFNIDQFISDFGSTAKAKEALDYFRSACIAAGFSGVLVFGTYNTNVNIDVSAKYTTVGLDYSVSYHWPSFSGLITAVPPPNGDIMKHQITAWSKLETATNLKSIPTVSIGWDSSPWNNIYYKGIWRLTPSEYENLLGSAKSFSGSKTYPDAALSKTIMLDNWNEYGEGHFIMPTRSKGFVDVDAVRNVFGDKTIPHKDIRPEDIGRGPY